MSNKLKIKLSVANRIYPLTISPSQEEGLRLAAQQINNLIKKFEQIPKDQKFVVSEYILNPLLIQNYKFDIRVYVMLYGCNPLRIFVYQDGLVRLCTEEYRRPTKSNIKNQFMHLTNYAINKLHTGFQQNRFNSFT